MLLKAPPTDKDRPKQTKTVGSPNGPVTFPNELLAFCKYVYIQPGKHKDGDGTVEQQEGEWWRRGWGMRSWWRGAAWWRPHISNSGILILICRAAPAHQLSSQTSGHPPPSSCHCHRKKKSFQVLLFLPSNTWVMKAERRRRKHVKGDCMDKASKASQLPQKSTCKALKMHIMS